MAEVLRVLSWNIQSPEFAANPLEFIPDKSAMRAVDRDSLEKLLEEAQNIMLCRDTPVTLDELLGNQPLQRATDVEKAPLDKLKPRMRAGITAWLESRQDQWRGMWPDWDAERAATEWCANHEFRWQYWRRQTCLVWLCDDGSGGKANPKLPKNSPMIDELCWDLGLSSADRAYGDLPARCRRSRLMRKAAEDQSFQDAKPKHIGSRDFFKLLVWDLLLNTVVKHLSDAKFHSLIQRLQPPGPEERMVQVKAQLRKLDPQVAVLVEVPSELPADIEEAWWVVRASEPDPVMNTVVLARKDKFLEPSAEEFMCKDGHVNPRFIGCELRLRNPVAGHANEIHIIGVHMSGSGSDFEAMADDLEQAIKPHTILAGDFNKDLRKKGWADLSLRPKLEAMVQGVGKVPMEYGTTSKERSPFQTQVTKMFLSDFVMKTFLLAGEYFGEYHITGCLTRNRRLPSVDIPSDHAPITMHLSLAKEPAGIVGPAWLGAIGASIEQLKDELSFTHFLPPDKLPCAANLMAALRRTDMLTENPGVFKKLLKISHQYLMKYEELAIDGYTQRLLEELSNVTGSSSFADYRSVLHKILTEEGEAYAKFKEKAAWLGAHSIKAYPAELDAIPDVVDCTVEHYAVGKLLLHEVFRPLVDRVPFGRKNIAELKHPFRVLEKNVMRTCGVPWDLVRAQIICNTMAEITEALEAIANAPGIVLVGLNDRFSSPKQGWADCSIYIMSMDAKYRSIVAEVQLVHQKLIRIHDKFGVHDMYAHGRFSSELLVKWYNVTSVHMAPWSAACGEAEPELVAAGHEQDHDPEKVTFWFVPADKLRDDGIDVLPRMQVLQGRNGWLVKRTLRFDEACRGSYSKEYLAVSHRWDTPAVPDPQGVQLQTVRNHLKDNPDIQFVWFDYWCMPQADRHGKRSKRETSEFRRMLSQVNLLYLGCSVLIILDLTYISRFWTQFEAWLSMQKASSQGLLPALDKERRCWIECIYGAPHKLKSSLLEMWSLKTPQEAYHLLSGADVVVTNQSDKTNQLPKLLHIDKQVQAAFPEQVQAASPAQVAGEWCPRDLFESAAEAKDAHSHPLASCLESFGALSGKGGRGKATIPRAKMVSIFRLLGLEDHQFEALLEAFGDSDSEVKYVDFLHWVFETSGRP